MRVLSGTTIHLSLYVTAASRLEIALDTTTIATGSTTTFLINTWYYIELKTVIGNAGSYEVRIDGVTELSSGSADTQNGGTADWTAVVLGGFNNGIADIMYDDWYICDNDNSDGLDNDDFLGDCIVEGVLASTGNGTNADSTPSTGTDRGALVDELPANEDTDYNTLAAVADTDTYNFAALTATGTVRGVRVNAQAKKTDTGVRTVSMVTRTNGTDYTHGDEVPLPTTYGNISQIFAANPDTGNKWTTSEVDNAEFGLTVAT
jgi:hypothetical protein